MASTDLQPVAKPEVLSAPGQAPTLTEALDTLVYNTDAASTASTYLQERGQLLEYFGNRRLDSFTTHELAKWRHDLAKKFKPSTMAKKLSVVRGMFELAHASGDIDRNPAVRLSNPTPVRDTTTRPTLSFEQLARLLDAPDHRTNKGKRDAAMLRLMANGLRREEVVKLYVDSIGFRKFKGGKKAKPAVVVEGKGNSRRQLLLSKEDWVEIEAWIKAREKMETDHDYLFVQMKRRRNRQGRYIHGSLSTRAVNRLVAGYGKSAGVGEIHPHLLRHTFCTLLSELGVPVEEIKELAGHADSRTTFAYTHVREGRTVSAMERFARSRS